MVEMFLIFLLSIIVAFLGLGIFSVFWDLLRGNKEK